MASERNLKTGEAQVLQKLHSIGKSSQIVSGQFVNVLMSDSLKRGTTLTALNATFSLWLLPALKERPFVAHRYLLGRENVEQCFNRPRSGHTSTHFAPDFKSDTDLK